MRSFSLLALAAAAIAPFVGAAPTPVADVASGAIQARHVDVAAGVIAGAAVHARTEQKGVQGILIDLKVNLGVHIDALKCLTTNSATSDVISVHVKGIVEVVGVAVVELKALVGADVSVILCAVDGTVQVTVAIIAGLLAEILCLIFEALGFVFNTVANVTILLDVLVAVAFGDCICGLIKAVLCLVDGLLVELAPLVVGLVSILLDLNLKVVGEVLNIC